MILKRDLLRGLDMITEQVVLQGELIKKLENRMDKIAPKRKPGRPRKNAK